MFVEFLLIRENLRIDRNGCLIHPESIPHPWSTGVLMDRIDIIKTPKVKLQVM